GPPLRCCRAGWFRLGLRDGRRRTERTAVRAAVAGERAVYAGGGVPDPHSRRDFVSDAVAALAREIAAESLGAAHLQAGRLHPQGAGPGAASPRSSSIACRIATTSPTGRDSASTPNGTRNPSPTRGMARMRIRRNRRFAHQPEGLEQVI